MDTLNPTHSLTQNVMNDCMYCIVCVCVLSRVGKGRTGMCIWSSLWSIHSGWNHWWRLWTSTWLRVTGRQGCTVTSGSAFHQQLQL